MNAARISSTPAFDWLMGILAVLQAAGVAQDGWAHSHGQVDQSFLTPWHAMLYGATAVTGIVLLVAGIRGLRLGYPARFALPFGYWTAAIGVALFIIGGLFDLVWHTIFGIEVDLQSLVSPSHLFLAFSAALIFSGPLRSIAHQYGPQTGGWRQVGPAVLAVFAYLFLVGFFTQYVQPLADDGVFNAIARGSDTPIGSIVRIDPRGGSQRRLTTGGDAFGASASPDGTRIVYRVDRANSPASDLFVAHADGSHPVQITNSGRHDTQPAWSPDGKWIAYSSQPAGTSGTFTIAVVSPQTRVTKTLVNGATTVQNPAWTPDSAHVVYASRNGTTPELASVPLSGGLSTWLTATAGGSAPAIAPNGALAFTRDGGIVVGAADGSNAKQVIAEGDEAAWSPDGKHLAYVNDENNAQQVFVANADGSAARNVSLFSGLDAARPAFARDGTLLTYVAGRPRTGGLSDVRALSAFMLQAITVVGLLLLLVLRWRVPAGAMTLVLGLFGIAMWLQSDLTPLVLLAPIATGIIMDIGVSLYYGQQRPPWLLYTIAAVTGAMLTAFFLAVVAAAGSYHWHPDLTLGTPLIGAVAGLLVAYCYRWPLPAAEEPIAAT